MNRLIGLLLLTSFCFFQACQKEESLESGGAAAASGTLQSDISGECLPKNVAGIYEAGKALKADSNYIEVDVIVTQAGAYTISTDTANGIHFKASGIFTSTGTITVKLKGAGTPTLSGISNFLVSFGTSSCNVPVTILPAGSANPAVFTLSGAPGTCMGAVVSGTYTAGTPLTAANNVVINVNVTTAGTYNITTATSNNIVFSGQGVLSTGAQTITLTASGTPTAAGPTNIPVSVTTTAGTSACGFVVNVTGPATFTINCATATVNGTYEERTALTAANTITVPVNVTAVGSYNVTGTINGMTFTASGDFTSTAAGQTITLNGAGTPANPGTSSLSLTVGSSTCNIPVTVTPVDYFPRTASSNWSYQYDGVANDSLFIRAKTGTVTLAGNAYNEFEWTTNALAGFALSGRYRKATGNYHAYRDMGAYFGFTNVINMDYIFLKDDVAVGTSWQTATINGIDSSNNTIPVRIVFAVEQKNATITVNGTPYNNTIVITEKYEVNAGGSNWIDITDILGYYKSYYSKNIGLIKEELYYEDGNPSPPRVYQQDMRRYQVF